MELNGDSWAIPMITKESHDREVTQFVAQVINKSTTYRFQKPCSTSSMGFTKNSIVSHSRSSGAKMFHIRS